MLQANAAHFVGQREQKFIAIKMLCTEQLQSLVNQRLVRGDMFGLRLQRLGFIGHDIQRDRIAQIPFAEMPSGKHRAVDQRFIIGLGIIDAVADDFRTIECGDAGPAHQAR